MLILTGSHPLEGPLPIPTDALTGQVSTLCPVGPSLITVVALTTPSPTADMPLSGKVTITPTPTMYEVSSPKRLVGHRSIVAVLTFSSDGSLIASASDDGSVKVWDADQGGLRYTQSADLYKMSPVDFSPDGSMLVTGGID